MEDKKEILLTQEGYQKLEDELERLKTVETIPCGFSITAKNPT